MSLGMKRFGFLTAEYADARMPMHKDERDAAKQRVGRSGDGRTEAL